MKSFRIYGKYVDNSTFYDKITGICKRKAEAKQSWDTRSERGLVKALCPNAAGHFQAAREDRDGRSRYRASKMPL